MLPSTSDAVRVSPLPGAAIPTLNRASLVVQAADTIRSHLLGGAWGDWLPSERELSRTLEISRNTCRKSLFILRREQLLELVPRRGVRINRAAIAGARRPAGHRRSVGILMPRAAEQLSPWMALAVGEIRRTLAVAGTRLDVHVRPACYRPDPGPAIETLAARTRHDAWIMVRPSKALQEWVSRRRLPAVVWGGAFPDAEVASVAPDYRAICRHAAGRLIALGHRRLVFLTSKFRGAAELESESGFLEGARCSSQYPIDARIFHHDETPASVVRLTRSQAMWGLHRPTGWVVDGAYAYHWAVGGLSESGLRVRDDFSILSRDDDVSLRFSYPEAARYALEPAAFARKLMTAIRKLLNADPDCRQAIRIMPAFVSGSSCARLAPRLELAVTRLGSPSKADRISLPGSSVWHPVECLTSAAGR